MEAFHSSASFKSQQFIKGLPKRATCRRLRKEETEGGRKEGRKPKLDNSFGKKIAPLTGREADENFIRE